MRIIKSALAGIVLMSTNISAPDAAENCISGLKPNTLNFSQNYAAAYQYLNQITQDNYAEFQKNGGVSIPVFDIPVTGSYAEFAKRRDAFSSMFDIRSKEVMDTNIVLSAFTEEAYQAYAECIRLNESAPISAWVSNYNSSLIFVTVKSHLLGAQEGRLEIIGAKPLNKPHPFTGAGEQTFIFDRPKGDSFLAAFQLSSPEKRIPLKTVTVEYPKEMHYRRIQTTKPIVRKAHCGAGCQGDAHKCQNVQDAEFVPDFGSRLVGKLSAIVTDNTGIARWSLNPEFDEYHARTALVCEADNPHKQKFVYIDVTATQLTDKIVSSDSSSISTGHSPYLYP